MPVSSRFVLYFSVLFLPLPGCLEPPSDKSPGSGDSGTTDDTSVAADASVEDDTGDPIQENRAPSAPVISLGPTDATTVDDLVVAIVADAADPDGDDITYVYKWLVGGLLTEASDFFVHATELVTRPSWLASAAARVQAELLVPAGAACAIPGAVNESNRGKCRKLL